MLIEIFVLYSIQFNHGAFNIATTFRYSSKFIIKISLRFVQLKLKRKKMILSDDAAAICNA